jgi:hypothetical protein
MTKMMIAQQPLFEVFIDDNDFVNVRVWGRWTVPEAEALEAAINQGLDALSKQGKPRLILYNSTELDVMHLGSPATINRLVQMISNLKYDALADFKVTPSLLAVTHLIGRIAPEFNRDDLFSTEAEAVAHLKQKAAEFKSGK